MSTAQIIIEDLINGDYKITDHASIRMGQRGVTRFDISCCAETCKSVVISDGKFLVSGVDEAGDELVLICGYRDGTVIVSVKGD